MHEGKRQGKVGFLSKQGHSDGVGQFKGFIKSRI